MVELWTGLPSATVGSNLHLVWCINRSEEETLCSYTHSRAPGIRVYVRGLAGGAFRGRPIECGQKDVSSLEGTKI